MDPFWTEIPWPDPEAGPLKARLTMGTVNGRPELIGFELWGVNAEWLREETDEQMLDLHPPEGRPERPTAISATDLRGPIKAAVEAALERHLQTARFVLATRPDQWKDPDAVFQSARSSVDTLGNASTSTRGRPATYPEEHFVEVARIYTEAQAAGLAPTRAVADAFGVPKSTAAKWVAKCRPPARNILPATSQGRAATEGDTP